ncbi:hypothetical protein LMG3458_06038 [Achromobacter deleyi]|uniref:Uncharacterized protein n=1 Tax=Achromobacter deleyi TaxID=1353891 RepID=A0A6S7B0B3_9BURK|nr:hypothetical protein [Achromobacter deleyi]CAB3743006.1 hypothetical protein LMG3458_06038 [Achromobacter deleyi]CAB3841578.1 hypothetical protein LMG3412_01275 [Achromobacter deleyi]CAB3864504.1 hypothetical protein LMG3481_02431 [Achromobacter deleyi]CAB3915213.1 hypothetical protein LMG3482_05057 [Achromobacter deleyi]
MTQLNHRPPGAPQDVPPDDPPLPGNPQPDDPRPGPNHAPDDPGEPDVTPPAPDPRAPGTIDLA